ncbi:uncharacterized protein TNCV_4938481 [Trichonephila clavipes]|nr:uncharacterized protein TNCV_4938481 [Trichonephila clavipes]
MLSFDIIGCLEGCKRRQTSLVVVYVNFKGFGVTVILSINTPVAKKNVRAPLQSQVLPLIFYNLGKSVLDVSQALGPLESWNLTRRRLRGVRYTTLQCTYILQNALLICYKQSTDNARSVALSVRTNSPRLIEDETFNYSDTINNVIDYEDGQEETDSLRANKIHWLPKHQGEEYPLVRCEGTFTIQVPMQRKQLCLYPSRDDREEPVYLGQENTFPGPDSDELLYSESRIHTKAVSVEQSPHPR